MTSLQLRSTAKDLQQRLAGRVIAPGDPTYDQARTVFYGGFDNRPALIVRAANADDVARVVSLARDSGLDLAVRSGGHSVAGHSTCTGGIVLDLSDMRRLEMDPEGRVAWAETGLTSGEYTVAAAKHSLATPFGDTGSVGLGGLTLGGGIGFLVRKYGLTIDSLLAADMVTAGGQLLHVSADSQPDLFWAIRGGGGNFGVVTRFQYRLHDVSSVVGGLMVLPATADVIAGFVAEAAEAPEELSTIANVMMAPPMPFLPPDYHGKPVIMALLTYVGEGQTGQHVVGRLRDLAKPIVDMVRPIRYPDMYAPEDESYHPLGVVHTLFVETVGRSVAQTILDHLHTSLATMAVAQLRVLGGAMARVPVDATAFAHRASRILVNLAAIYQQPADKPLHQAWLAGFAAAMQQGDRGVYANFLADEPVERVQAAYPGETWRRLAALKARHDPTNLFHRNQNIAPASGSGTRLQRTSA